MRGRNTILIVDDMEVNRAILCSLFEHEYDLLEAENGVDAMELLMEHANSIAVMLLDIVMPLKDGFQVLQEMNDRGLLSSVPVIVITTEDSTESEVRSFDLGAVDIVVKPFEPHVIKRRVKNIIELYRHKLHLEELVEEQACSLRESNEVLVDALSSVIEHRSLESGQHILRIRMFTKILLQNVSELYEEYFLDKAKIDLIASAAAMHDIGKIAIPDSILNKPGKLTKEEFEIMKTHTTKGCEILEGLGRMNDKEYLQYAYEICRYHHERWDGKGYPEGLKGDSIPICAQVAGIADAYDALTTDRVYKKAYSHEKAKDMILNGECGSFSPKILQCFENVGQEFEQLAQEYADGRSPHMDMFSELNSKSPAKVIPIRHGALMEKEYIALLKHIHFTVFEIDLVKDTYETIYLDNDIFDLFQSEQRFIENIREFVQIYVHPEDRSKVEYALLTFSKAGAWRPGRAESIKSRIQERGTQEYHWYNISMIYLNTDIPKALLTFDPGLEQRVKEDAGGEGVISDTKELQNKDYLTGLLHRSATKQKAESFLMKEDKDKNHALFVIDIDDFKQINENYGHLVGDELLKKVALCIVSQFCTDDIIGRIGGDEFVVLLKNVTDNSFIHRKASSLIWEISKVFSGTDKQNHASVSVGISRFPVDGSNYDELLKKANLALYSAKRCGKDQWQIFTETHFSGELSKKLPEAYVIEQEIEKRASRAKTSIEELTEQIIKLFFELDDEDKTIKVALDMTARYYHLNHIFVYLQDALGRMKKVFDWRSENERKYYNYPQLDQKQTEQLFRDLTNEDGVLVCNDVTEIDGKIGKMLAEMNIGALLNAPIRTQEHIAGYVGFSDKAKPHQWTDEEIKICIFLAKLVDLIYVKRKSVRKLEEINKISDRLFDKIDVESYVIDESFEILKVNQKMEGYGVKMGEKCYKAFRKQEHPCQECPVMKLSKSCHTYSTKLYLSTLQREFKITACDLEWNNARKAFLITCRELNG